MNKQKINNSYYELELVEQNHTVFTKHDAIALCDTTMKKIYLPITSNDIGGLLIHEVTHAVIYEYLTEVDWNEEKVCQFMQRYHTIINDIVYNFLEELK